MRTIDGRGVRFYSDPFDVMRAFQGEINRLFDPSRHGLQQALVPANYPPVNVWSNQEQVVITALLAGIKPESVELTVLGDTLTIRGGAQPMEQVNEGRSIRRERANGEFSRSIELPFAVESEGVEAHYKAGVLTLTLVRAAAERPKRISVRAS